MTVKEYQQLIEATGQTSRLGEVLRFLALTGCRPCEIRDLRWAEIDFAKRIIELRHHKTSRTQRTPRPRVIVLVPRAVKILKVIRGRKEHADFVFVSRLLRPWGRNSVEQQLRRLRRKMGLPEDVVLYGVRHRFVTESLKSGVDLKTTSDLVGHASTKMTEYYSHLDGEQDHRAMAARRATKWA
jgi:integrase